MALSPLFNLTAEAAPPMIAEMRTLTGLGGTVNGELPLWRLLRVFDAPPAGTEYQVTGVTFNLYPGMPLLINDLWNEGLAFDPWGWSPTNTYGLKPMNAWVVVGKNLERLTGANAADQQAVRAACSLPGILETPLADDAPNISNRIGPSLIAAQHIPEGSITAANVREVRYKDNFAPDVVRVGENERLCVAMVFSRQLADSLVEGNIAGCLSVQIHHRVAEPTRDMNR